jgi:hypothetical protein
MPIWDYSIRQITDGLDCRQFHFLTVGSTELYLSIIIELYRARKQETMHELPFDLLYERLSVIQSAQQANGFEAGDLHRALNQLDNYRNIKMRLEPRRVRRIADRGLKLLLVRLTERTYSILEHLESQIEEIEQETASSARFSLLEVDDALGSVASLVDAVDSANNEDCCRAARELFRARRAVEEAGDDLLARDLWLSETAVQTPDRQRLADLLVHLETYFERYLYDVDERRGQCFEKLERLLTQDAEPFLEAVQQATAREFAEDPTRAGRRPPEIRPILRVIWDFLRPSGILDDRRLVVHQRLADVAGHLKRYLAELVRRSQLVAGLRELTHGLLQAPECSFQSAEVDEFFLRLWQPAHVVLDETSGIPNERAVPPRPYIYRRSGSRRFAGAIICPSDNGQPKTGRPLLIKQMENLNEFVTRAVLRGAKEALVSEASLDDMNHVRLLIAAIRMARQGKSRLRQRHLQYSVALPTEEKQVILVTADGSGRLHLPQLIFNAGTKSRRGVAASPSGGGRTAATHSDLQQEPAK